jgi:hypothetical protein
MQLPVCHSRRHIEPASSTFFCAHPRHHSALNLVTAELCVICPLWREPPPATFRPVPLVMPKPRGTCAHLGEQTGLRDCPSCRGSVRVKLFACSHPLHVETTLAECATCPDFEPRNDTETPSVG